MTKKTPNPENRIGGKWDCTFMCYWDNLYW